MTWKIIYESVIEFFKIGYCLVDKLGEICLTIIGVYTFYRTFLSKRIRFLGIGFSSSRWKGESFHVDIQNWSLSAISIRKVYIVVDNDYRVLVKEYSKHFLLEPLKAIRIDSDKMSESPFFDETINILDKKLKLYIICSDGKVLSANYKRKRHGNKIVSLNKKRYKTVVNSTIDGVLYTPNIKYFIYIIDRKGNRNVTCIDKQGCFKDNIAGHNAVGDINLNDKKEVKRTIEQLVGRKYKVQVYDVLDIVNK